MLLLFFFVAFFILFNFIFYRLLVVVIYKGPKKLLIVVIELGFNIMKDPVMCPLVIGFFVLAAYWNACSDLGTRYSYSLCNFVSQA